MRGAVARRIRGIVRQINIDAARTRTMPITRNGYKRMKRAWTRTPSNKRAQINWLED